MNGKVKALCILLVLAVAAGGLYWYKTQLKWYERTVDVSASSHAKRHSMLAARRYLNHFGYKVRHFESREFFSALPDTRDTIIVRKFPQSLRTDTYQDLEQWVSNGGQIVTSITSKDEMRMINEIFEVFQVHFYDNEYDAGYQYLEIEKDWLDEPIYVEVYAPFEFSLSDRISTYITAGADQKFVFSQFSYGDGSIVVSLDEELWDNTYIGEDDNARLLSLVMAQREAQGTVHINDTEIQITGVFSLLWLNFKWLCILSMILGLAVLRRSWVRFGPMQQLQDERSNNFGRHLEAIAQYHFRYGCSDQLLKPVQGDLLARFSNSKFKIDNSQQDEIVSRAARVTGLHEIPVKKALYTDEPSVNTLVAITRSLQAIQQAMRNKLKE